MENKDKLGCLLRKRLILLSHVTDSLVLIIGITRGTNQRANKCVAENTS